MARRPDACQCWNSRFSLNTEVLELGDDRRIKVRDQFKREKWLDNYDDIVVAVGYRSRQTLLPELLAAGLNVEAVGDASQVGKVMGAIHSGFKAAYAI